MVELLAPAGSREAFIAAVESGANAVYLAGSMFGARAYADNFDEQGMREAIRFAHLRGVQVHVTVNTIVDDQELASVKSYLRFLSEAGADAVLVQDLGVARLVRETVPELPLHASTQMTVHNLDGVQALEALGFSRVVLSREVSLEAVRHICAHAKAEIEVFVHGALCVCYSGQCLMSSMIGGRSGNRGRCAQPCRLPYTLVDEQDHDLLRDSAGKYLLSPRDLNTLELLPELLAAGVASLKIEGRMKKPEYVAVAVGCYRRAVDSFLSGQRTEAEADKMALAQIFNRDFTTAYLEKKQGRSMMSDKRPNNRGLMLGRVLEYDEAAGLAVMKLTAGLAVGDQVDFWVKIGGRLTATVHQLYVVKGQKPGGKKGRTQARSAGGINQQDLVSVKAAEPGMTAAFAVEGRVFGGDRAFKVYDGALMENARALYNTGAPVRRIGLRAVVRAAVGEPLTVFMEDAEGNKAAAATDFVGQAALKRPLTKETVAKQISRLGTSIFELKELETEIEGEVMVPVSELNEVRRRCVEMLEAERLAKFNQRAGEFGRSAGEALRSGIEAVKAHNELRQQKLAEPGGLHSSGRKGAGITVVADTLEKLRAALEAGAEGIVFGGETYNHQPVAMADCREAAGLAHAAGARLIYNTPRIIRDSELASFHKWLVEINGCGGDGINVHNIGSLYAAAKLTGLPIEADYSLVSYNCEALRHLQELGVSRAVLSPELNFTQLARLSGEAPLPLECLVDGNLELMVSEYCCPGSFLGGLDTGSCSAPCSTGGRQFFLKDRKNVRFPLVMDQFCHTHLLNANRLSMLPHAMKFKAMGIKGLRIDGRYMDSSQLKNTIKNYIRYMSCRGELDEFERAEAERLEGSGITRGHYFRGVL
ncbi:MAG: U32 family peptidase [Anaerovibrio sp.]|nr:U32 family peptidase [Anaerovibrio sp.]